MIVGGVQQQRIAVIIKGHIYRMLHFICFLLSGLPHSIRYLTHVRYLSNGGQPQFNLVKINRYLFRSDGEAVQRWFVTGGLGFREGGKKRRMCETGWHETGQHSEICKAAAEICEETEACGTDLTLNAQNEFHVF